MVLVEPPMARSTIMAFSIAFSVMIFRAVSILVLLALLPALIEAGGLKGAALAMIVTATFSLVLHASALFLMIRRPASRETRS